MSHKLRNKYYVTTLETSPVVHSRSCQLSRLELFLQRMNPFLSHNFFFLKSYFLQFFWKCMSRISWIKNDEKRYPMLTMSTWRWILETKFVGDKFEILETEFHGKWNESEMCEFIVTCDQFWFFTIFLDLLGRVSL